MLLYRRMRARVRKLLVEAKQAGYSQVWLDAGEENNGADILDICRLTCLEQGILLADRSGADLPDHFPCLEIRGMKVFLHFDDGSMKEARDGDE